MVVINLASKPGKNATDKRRPRIAPGPLIFGIVIPGWSEGQLRI